MAHGASARSRAHPGCRERGRRARGFRTPSRRHQNQGRGLRGNRAHPGGASTALNGRTDEAQRIEETLLRQFDSAPGEYTSVDTLWIRAFAPAALGQRDAAIAELARATDQGFRTLIDFEYFVRLEDYPFMRDVVADPRYLELATRIEADNARMREALLAAGP